MPRTVDTRFFITHFLADTDHLRMKTSRKMIELQREKAVVPTIVIHEIYKLVREKLGKDIAQLRVSQVLASSFRIVDLTAQIALTSASLRCEYRSLATADSVIAGTSIETKSRRVLSDDPHFREIREIRCEWL
jgi:predicted nucleic acid-binding protein